MIVILFGHLFIPEDVDNVDDILGDDWQYKYNDVTKTTIAWGVEYGILSEVKIYQGYESYGIHSRHMTIVFNIYTLMLIFNFFNCRKSDDNEFNIFSNFNCPSLICLFLSLCLQVLCVQFGG